MAWLVAESDFTGDDADDMSTWFDEAGQQSKVGVVVFPSLRSASDICELLRLLNINERWTVEKREWKPGDPWRPELLVSLRWRTAANQQSSVMGLAPMGSMPVHRRAPYVCLALWPGKHDNVHYARKLKAPKPEPRPVVGFLDAKLLPKLVPEDVYDLTWDSTSADVATLRTLPPEGAARVDVSFCLPLESEATIFGS